MFIALKKTYERVPRQEMWFCERKTGMAEKYVRAVKDMHDDTDTSVK